MKDRRLTGLVRGSEEVRATTDDIIQQSMTSRLGNLPLAEQVYELVQDDKNVILLFFETTGNR